MHALMRCMQANSTCSISNAGDDCRANCLCSPGSSCQADGSCTCDRVDPSHDCHQCSCPNDGSSCDVASGLCTVRPPQQAYVNIALGSR